METIPPAIVTASWRNYVVWVGGPSAILCLLFSVGAWFHSGWLASLTTSFILWPSATFLVWGTASGVHQKLRTHIPAIQLRNDELNVRYGDRQLKAKIHDCHLRYGRAAHMRLAGGVKLYSMHSVILIDLPPIWNSVMGMRRPVRNTIALGFTVEMRTKWERAFSTLPSKCVFEGQ